MFLTVAFQGVDKDLKAQSQRRLKTAKAGTYNRAKPEVEKDAEATRPSGKMNSGLVIRR